jgi:hypothetical protein
MYSLTGQWLDIDINRGLSGNLKTLSKFKQSLGYGSSIKGGDLGPLRSGYINV